MAASTSSGHTTATIFEYTPNKKINSVPAGATPYRRDLPGNILVITQWLGDEPELLVAARKITHGIAELFVSEVRYEKCMGITVRSWTRCLSGRRRPLIK